MMKKNKKEYYVLGAIIIGFIIIAFISYIYEANKNSHPFDSIRDMRSDIVENYELIDIEKTETGTIVYSVGKVNKGADNLYFVDMVEKSLMGYKWVGGGGHINHDTGRSKNFVFSSQLLDEEQNVKPTIFGVFTDKKIRNINVRTWGNELFDAIIYDRKSEGEKFYYIHLTNNVSNYKYFIFTITYGNDKRVEYHLSDDEFSEFQEGKWLHFY